ncbi:response regulator [Enterovibrio sp. 27052020O]|uniref:response regulator n=1 Tax=Enterovibrio sp. 27052020O TaxID=3241166 RepID=UPI00388E5886
MYRVLIVEDDNDIAMLHAHFIEQDPRFKVLSVASTLAQARAMTRAASLDLIIVDNYLPDGLGVDFVHTLSGESSHVECVLVTAANDAETVQKALRFGAFDYLVKPLDYRRLADSLERFSALQQQFNHEKQFIQRDLDGLFSGAQKNRKQVSSTDAFTLKQIVDYFSHAHIEVTVSHIAEEFGISKSTARRYLDQAVEDGELLAFLEHGKVGRPTRVYRRPLLEEL